MAGLGSVLATGLAVGGSEVGGGITGQTCSVCEQVPSRPSSPGENDATVGMCDVRYRMKPLLQSMLT